MDTFDQWAQLGSLDANTLIQAAFQSLQNEITAMNRKQLMSGHRADDTNLPPYSPAYARKKGKPLTPKTLYDTGAFHKAFYLLAFNTFAEMGSRDRKADMLEGQWGDIYGPDNANHDLIVELLHTQIMQALNVIR